MIRVSDFIVKFLEKKGIKNVFGDTGGGAMYINDSFGKSKKYPHGSGVPSVRRINSRNLFIS